MSRRRNRKRLIVMVASSVYQNKALLDKVYAVLTEYGYEVWMSHRGTIPVTSDNSNLMNCLEAVERCDLFLGIITPFYGSGLMEDAKSITHHELLKAIERDKLRWIVADYRVNFARQIMRQFRFDENDSRRAGFEFRKTAVLDHIGVIEMYEDATRQAIQLGQRTGHWVQEYLTEDEAMHYISSQLGDVDRVREMLKRHEEQNA